MANVARDTIPSPPPGSGEFPVVQIEISSGSRPHAPQYVETVLSELRGMLAVVCCADHGTAPALSVSFGEEEDAIVAVVPHNCCNHLDDLVANALRSTPIFRLLRPK